MYNPHPIPYTAHMSGVGLDIDKCIMFDPLNIAFPFVIAGATAALSLAAASLWVNQAAKKAIGCEAYEKCRGKDEHDTPPISPGLYLAGLNCSQVSALWFLNIK